MTPWSRVDTELTQRKREWKWLAEKIGVEKMQTVNHWKNRGIPSRHYSEIETALEKYSGWILGKAPEPAPIPYTGPSSLGRELALVFDMIPESEPLKRTKAYALATSAIVAILQGENVTLQREQGK